MSRQHSRKRTHPKPKAILRLPDLDQAKSGFISNLGRGTINLRLGAVRPLAYEAADCGPSEGVYIYSSRGEIVTAATWLDTRQSFLVFILP